MQERIDITGNRYGMLVVKEFAYSKHRKSYWLCKCDCGNEKIIYGGSLKKGGTKSCGCSKNKSKYVGKIINGYEVISSSSKVNKVGNNRVIFYKVKCIYCGTIKEYMWTTLNSKNKSVCECKQEKYENEKFVEVIGTDGRYKVSNLGRVYSTVNKIFLKPKITKDGYYMVTLWLGDKMLYKRIHRLVAEAFCKNPNGYEIVNHIDMNKLNNNSNNLEWCTNQQNIQHWWDNDEVARERFAEHRKKSIPIIKKPIVVYKNGKYIGTFDSKTECAESLNISPKTIYNGLNNLYKNRDGYEFKLKGGDANVQN